MRESVCQKKEENVIQDLQFSLVVFARKYTHTQGVKEILKTKGKTFPLQLTFSVVMTLEKSRLSNPSSPR
jgi:hypothetical protein